MNAIPHEDRMKRSSRRILVPPGVLTRNHIKGERLCVQGHCLLRWHAEEAILEAHLALLSAQVRYQREILWLKRRRQQRQQQKRRRLWCREWPGPLRRRQFGLYDQLMVELRREDPVSFRNSLRMPPCNAVSYTHLTLPTNREV